MRKYLAIVALSIGLGGCFTSVDINTSVSRNTLYGVVNTYGVALSAETTYKTLCANGTIAGNCRDIVARLQAADKKAVAAIVAANSFIKTYPTVDATNIIAAANSAVKSFKTATDSTGAQ